MRMRARITVDNTRSITQDMVDAARLGVREVLEDALQEANDETPLDEGDLVRSGEVVMDPNEPRGAVTYDTPYAVRQHEDPTLNHPRQGRHHWLERQIEDNAGRYTEHIAKRIRDATT